MSRYLWPQLADVPHELGFVDAQGVQTRFLSAGVRENPALLLLHGFGSHLETFFRNVAAFSRAHRVIAIDMLGHGYTDAPARPYEVGDYVAHARATLAVLGVERLGLVGVALGSWVAARYAIDHPEEVESLTLCSPTGLTADQEAMERVRKLSLDAVENPDTTKAQRRLAAVFVDQAGIPEDLIENRLDVLAQPHAPAATRNVLALQEMSYRSRNLLRRAGLESIAAPALVVSGTLDELSPPQVGDEFAEAIPNARRVLVEGGGHWLHFERPDEFNSIQLNLQGPGR